MEVQAALTAIQALETADSQEQPLPSEIELQEDLRGLSEQKQVLRRAMLPLQVRFTASIRVRN